MGDQADAISDREMCAAGAEDFDVPAFPPRWRCQNCGYRWNRGIHCDGCDLTKSEGDALD